MNKNVQVLSAELKLLSNRPRFIGISKVVSCHSDFLSVLNAIHDAVTGDVVMVETGGDNIAYAGELFANEAKRRGLAALIIDGYMRDARVIVGMDFPVYARGFCPMAGSSNKLFEKPRQIVCGGTEVKNGEMVFGDEDGVIVMSPEEFVSSLSAARRIQASDGVVPDKIREGASLFDLTNFKEHVAEVKRAGHPSLTFRI